MSRINLDPPSNQQQQYQETNYPQRNYGEPYSHNVQQISLLATNP